MRNWVLANLSKDWGGGEKWLLTTAASLKNKGNNVLCLVRDGSVLATQLRKFGVPFLIYNTASLSVLNPLSFLLFCSQLKKKSDGIFLFNSAHELKTFGLIAKFLRFSGIILRRGIPKGVRHTIVNRWYFRNILDHVVVNSRATLLAMEAIWRDEIKFLSPQVIYNGIDLQIWSPQVQNNPTGVIGVVGRLSYEKGIDRAILVFHEVRKKLDSKLWILGTGKEKKRLEEMISELGIKNDVSFLGFQQDIAKYMQKFDILLVPSRWEGFGYVLLEAMSMEVPPVAFEIDATKEIIVDGTTGVLVEDGRLEECSEKIIDLLKCHEKRKVMGKRARKHVEDNFSLSKTIMQLDNLGIPPYLSNPNQQT